MTKQYNISLKEKIPYLLIGLACFTCTMFSGGLGWQDCIIPLLLLNVCIVMLNGHRKNSFTIPLMFLVLLCGISIFISKGNPQTSIYEACKFLCFIASASAGYLLKDDKRILKIFFISTLVVAVLGLFACCGIIKFDEFVFKDGSIVRLQSAIKYANVTACVLGCGYIAFLELFLAEKKRVYLYAGSCILIAMYFTFSKACIPIFLITCTFYVYNNKNLSKILIIHNMVAIALLGVMLFAIPKHMNLLMCVLIPIGVIISGKVDKNYDKGFAIWTILLSVLAVAAITVIILYPSLLKTFTIRIQYMKDALMLIKENPALGCGFGSWRVMQYGVQTEQYNVTYLHNGILQMVVENGIIFTLSFLALITYAIFAAVKSKKYYFIAITLIIVIHSLIDCDLSFGSVLIMLGLTIGSMLPDRKNIRALGKIVNCMFIALLCISNVYMITEYAIRYSFERSYMENDYSVATSELDKLVMLCPLDAQLKVTEAAIEEKTTNNTVKILRKLEKAVKLSPYDPEIFEDYMDYNMDKKIIEDLCMRYIEMAPKQERTYAFLKQYIIKAKNKELVSKEMYSLLYDKIEARRIEEKVIDRNDLLNQIINDKD